MDGKSVIHATNLTIRTDAASTFRGVHFQTFFGGSTVDWATPVDQYVYFADVSGAVLAAGASPADGKAAYPLRTTPLPANSTGGAGNSTAGGTGDDGKGAAASLTPMTALLALVGAAVLRLAL